jgi:dual specificity tyrosine-phosphorylation-regulated kinase 2/3/4
MTSSRPPFNVRVRKSASNPPESQQLRLMPVSAKPHPPVAHLNLKLDPDFLPENEPQLRNPRHKLFSARCLAFSNPRFRRGSPATQRSIADLSPVVSHAPIPPSEACAKYISLLNHYELEEISGFPEIYYLGQPSKKVHPNRTGASNHGYDDREHHYRCSPGDHIAYRFEIRAILGKGAFGAVLRCFDHKTQSDVALKLIINTEQMHEQGKIEVSLLQRLSSAPGFKASYIVRGIDFFVFRRHICSTFEILGLNLYEYSRSLRFRPIEASQMRPIARSILSALAFMHRESVVHCDMKPENVLLCPESSTDVRVIDFGSSCVVGQQRYEYIQSRFYRAPEVILGLSYGPPMDIWSFACIVAELMMGRPLFAGDDEAEQIQMLMEVLGAPPRHLIDRCARRKHFFLADGTPLPAGRNRRRRQIRGMTLRQLTKINDNLLLDLLGKCLEWDQNKRITAPEAINHPWFAVREVPSARFAWLRWR